METEIDIDKSKPSISFRYYFLVGTVVFVLLISVVQSFQMKELKNKITSNVIKNTALDMNSWTEDEKMQYEHHGIMPARFQQSRQASQVGSC